MIRMKTLLHQLTSRLFTKSDSKKDPLESIGTCVYCDEIVRRKDGDFDAEGRTRHDDCDHMARALKLDEMQCAQIFRHVSQLVRDLPGMLHPLNRAIEELPENFEVEDVLDFVLKLERATLENSRLSGRRRALALENFRELKQTMFLRAA